jgi:hypothetical protein
MKAIFKVVLKTKNEDFLIEPWIKYYINLVGAENIIIWDDNSTSKKTLEVYEKYSSLDIRKIPSASEVPHMVSPDSLHTYRELQEELKKTCHFWALFDTDEFLCFFDHQQQKIDNAQLLQFMRSHIDRVVFPTTWIFNMYEGKDFESIDEVVNFKFNLTEFNLQKGKAIVASSAVGEKIGRNVGHNSSLNISHKKIDLLDCPQFLLLHLQDVNWKIRVNTKIDFCRSLAGLKFLDTQDLLRQLSVIKKRNYYQEEIFQYYTDIDKFLAKRTANNIVKNLPFLVTDVIPATINGGATHTELVNFSKNTKEYLQQLFLQGFAKFDKLSLRLT